MKRTILSLLVLGSMMGAETLVAQQGGGQNQAPITGGQASWTPTRINKAIELLESGQPIYYAQITAGGYEEGLRMAQTPADYITYNLEHYGVDFTMLREFMRGLVEGGPTKSGHRTPAVIVVAPAVGWTETAMQGNTWMMQNIINAGVHGILLPHAVDPAAVRLMIESIRYPTAPPAEGLGIGMQGNGSQGYAAGIWGLSGNEYQVKSDVWPLNPNGELLIGVKIETHLGVARAREMVNTPGLGFAEWGPGDQGLFLGGFLGLGENAPNNHPRLNELRETVFQAVRDADKYFLNSCGTNDVVAMIEEGVMICTGGTSQAAQIGRLHSNRQMPW